MKKIYIVTKYEFIFSNIKDYLLQYLDVSISMVEDLLSLNKLVMNNNDLIILFNSDNEPTVYSNLKLIKANIIVLTKLKFKNYGKNNIKVMLYPVNLKDLLNTIKSLDINNLSNINEYCIPGYKLKLVYEEITLESIFFSKTLNMTVTEGKILKKLFINYPAPVSKNDINVVSCSKTEVHSVETHIFNIKKKLIQENFQLEIKKENDYYKLVITNSPF